VFETEPRPRQKVQYRGKARQKMQDQGKAEAAKELPRGCLEARHCLEDYITAQTAALKKNKPA